MSGIVLVILDGLGDRQHAELGGLTPLEAANTPALDALASAGSTGMLWPLGPGSAPTSPLAHFTLFGYPAETFPGRGLIEALGEGVVPAAGEVVCRANFARAEERDGTLWLIERPDPRLGEPVNADVSLDMELDGVACHFLHTGAAQGMLLLRSLDGSPLSPHVTDADPLRAGASVRRVLPWSEATDFAAAEKTARAMNSWMLETRSRLAGHDLDMATVKWPGAAADLPRFSALTGLRGVTLARGVLYAGLAAALGLDAPGGEDADDLADDLHTDLGTALTLLDEGYDFVHVHSKWPDRAGHRKSPQRKREVAELLDAAIAPHVSALLASGHVVCVTADHQTPSSGPLYHSGGAVPLLVLGGVAGRDSVAHFSEAACAQCSLGHLRGHELMPLLLDCADRSAFLGAERYTAQRCLGTARDEDVVALRPAEG